MSEPKCFYLQRDMDVTGASGTGRVADGVLWTDDAVSIRWYGEHKSFVNWDTLDDALAVHLHEGLTRVVWLDNPNTPSGVWGSDG